jgi:hypothetical protein
MEHVITAVRPAFAGLRWADGKIEHYERMAASIFDQLTIDRIKVVVEQMKAQRAALHPEKG